jgi:hypothetical protein
MKTLRYSKKSRKDQNQSDFPIFPLSDISGMRAKEGIISEDKKSSRSPPFLPQGSRKETDGIF